VHFGGTGGTLDLIIYGALIVLICIFKPEGLIGFLRSRRADSAESDDDAQS